MTNVAILTYAPDRLPGNADLLALARANRDEYCSRWGYTHLTPLTRHTDWYYAVERLQIVADLFATTDYQVIWVLNVSSTITNMRIPLDSYLHGGPDVYAYFAQADRNGLNAGSVVFVRSFGIRNWMSYVITEAIDCKHPWYEQFTLQELAQAEPVHFCQLRNPSINQYHHRLIGWPEGEAQDWRRGDFVLSLPGIPLELRAEYVRTAHKEVVR